MRFFIFYKRNFIKKIFCANFTFLYFIFMLKKFFLIIEVTKLQKIIKNKKTIKKQNLLI